MKKKSDIYEGFTPPSNVEMEKCILATLVGANDDIKMFSISYLDVDDFYREEHKEIFVAIKDCITKGEFVDLITLTNHLKELTSYILDIAINIIIGDVYNIYVNYCREIRELTIKRNLILELRGTITKCYTDENIMDILDVTSSSIENLEKSIYNKSTREFSEIVGEAFEIVKTKYNNKGIVKDIDLGIVDIDKSLLIKKTDLVAICGRPAMGKSLILAHSVSHQARQGFNVGVISLEMQGTQIATRLASQNLISTSSNLNRGDLLDDLETIEKVYENLKPLRIFIDDVSFMDIETAIALVRSWVKKHNIDVVWVDYLQLIEVKDKKVDTVKRLSEITRKLKALAKSENISVITLAQINRDAENNKNKKPELRNVYGSDSLTQDCDSIILIHRPEKYEPNGNYEDGVSFKGIMEMEIAKQRDGTASLTERVMIDLGNNRIYSRNDNISQSFKDLTDDEPF